jgi:hypothetical protein
MKRRLAMMLAVVGSGLALSVLTGCGGSDDNTDGTPPPATTNEPPPVVENTSIVGHWVGLRMEQPDKPLVVEAGPKFGSELTFSENGTYNGWLMLNGGTTPLSGTYTLGADHAVTMDNGQGSVEHEYYYITNNVMTLVQPPQVDGKLQFIFQRD